MARIIRLDRHSSACWHRLRTSYASVLVITFKTEQQASTTKVLNMAFPSVKKGNKIADTARKPKPGCPLDYDMIQQQIIKYSGNLSRAADSIGSSRGAVRGFIDRHPELQQILKDCRERQIDELEESVFERAVDSTDTTLQMFVLKTQGRHRGWEQNEAQNTAKDIATAAFDFILNKSKNPAEPSQ